VRPRAGGVLLFDCGSLDERDVGERVVAPFLGRRGFFEPVCVRVAFLSHLNLDHYSGLPALARRGVLRQVVASPGPVELEGAGAAGAPGGAGGAAGGAAGGVRRRMDAYAGSRAAIERLGRQLAAYDVKVRRASAGAAFDADGLRGELLWPPEWIGAGGWRFVNDSSQVVRLRFAGRSVMLTGDISTLAQQRLLDGQAAGQLDLRTDVLVMPHHGAVVRNTDAFVRAVDPAWVIISTRRSSDRIVSRCPSLRDPGRRVLLTSEVGAVTVSISPEGELRVGSVIPATD